MELLRKDLQPAEIQPLDLISNTTAIATMNKGKKNNLSFAWLFSSDSDFLYAKSAQTVKLEDFVIISFTPQSEEGLLIMPPDTLFPGGWYHHPFSETHTPMFLLHSSPAFWGCTLQRTFFFFFFLKPDHEHWSSHWVNYNKLPKNSRVPWRTVSRLLAYHIW